MNHGMKRSMWALATMLCFSAAAGAQALSGETRAKVEKHAASLKSMGTSPQVVAAVKAHNANPPAPYKKMTNAAWKDLTLLDPLVRNLAKSDLGQFLKSRKTEVVTEAFVSSADGSKVAFLSKTTSWNHKGKPKHDVPMSGQVWIGSIEVDESTGQQQVQVGIPVLDGGRPIGSLVIGLSVAKL